jgi:hypothetical protein
MPFRKTSRRKTSQRRSRRRGGKSSSSPRIVPPYLVTQHVRWPTPRESDLAKQIYESKTNKQDYDTLPEEEKQKYVYKAVKKLNKDLLRAAIVEYKPRDRTSSRPHTPKYEEWLHRDTK